MKLTNEEFKRIRQLQWGLNEIGGKMYNTPSDSSQTQLFWLDFMKLVFAPKFKKQFGITHIDHFDVTQPVLMEDNLNLKLPTQLETAMYYANNTTLPMKFSIGISQTITFIVALVVLVALIVLNYMYDDKVRFKNII